MQVDYIIVGQGLAGSAVAMQLIRRNKKIVVFDQAQMNSSSRIAAGLFNPITGKKMTKTWLADTIFPYLHEYYQSVEKDTRQKFFHPMPIYRPFLSMEEQNEWMVRSAEEIYKPYIGRVQLTSFGMDVKDLFGGLLLTKGGYLNTTGYVSAVREFLKERMSLVQEIFQPEEILFGQDSVSYKQYHASAIIWCSGIHKNKFFDWLPVRPLKGETVTIEAAMRNDVVLNRGVYMVPGVTANTWRVGSTYYFQDKTECVTDVARKELEEKIGELINLSFKVIDHQWGFRPTTPDRRPIIGSHPSFERLVCFNGLGTKGVSLAPYFSEVLVRWLEKEGSLNKEVDIERFKSVYSGSSK